MVLIAFFGWTSWAVVNLPSSEPIFGFGFTNLFPGITFDRPVAITSAPGDTNRLFIAEKTGRIFVVTNLAQPKATLFLDLRPSTFVSMESGLLGLAFHPQFYRNGRFFVYRVREVNGFYDQLSEFYCDPRDSRFADPNTEKVLISTRDLSDTHNGGDLKFGPDGYLYLSLGDEGPVFPDIPDTPQAIDKGLFAGIIRIDVDSRPENLVPNAHPSVVGEYRIPRDNPFVNASTFNGGPVDSEKVRTEFYAVGMRNPWRFTFNPYSGAMICADVGAGAIEEINIVQKGGNYGWPFLEGTNLLSADPLPDGLIGPIHWYRHGLGQFNGNVVVGGVVYGGNEFPGLRGKYLFADFASGNVWAITPAGTQPQPSWLTARTGITTFGVHPADGGILVANHIDGRIERLTYTSPDRSRIPRTLREVNAFENLETLAPINTMRPFEVINPLWSDGAHKQRWFDFSRALDHVGFKESEAWEFPEGMIWTKHFELELTNGIPASRRRVETRFLVKTADDIYGVTYRWLSGTNAVLVPPQGASENFVIHDSGTIRTQVWSYPSWNQCRDCHNKEAGFVLGFRTHQLNRGVTWQGRSTNQLDVLAELGMFEPGTSVEPSKLANLVALDDPHAPAEYRVRSYLESNCMQCHLPNGRSAALWDARIATPLSQASIVGHPPVFYPAPSKVIDPGNLANSYMLFRVSNRSPLFQMPPLATSVTDQQFIDVLSDWITHMPPSGWSSTNWGQHLAEGALEARGEKFRISSAAGGYATGSLFFAARAAFGSSEISARVGEAQSASAQGEVGLMLAQDLGGQSSAVALIRKAEQLILVATQDAREGFAVISSVPSSLGDFLKLVHDGRRVAAWVKGNSADWRQIGVVETSLGNEYFAGMVAASDGKAVQFATAEIDDMKLTSVRVSNPPAGATFTLPLSVDFSADVSTYGSAVSFVSFFNENQELGRSTNEPWHFTWSYPFEGVAGISAAMRGEGLMLTSPPIAIEFVSPPSEVWLKPFDVSTLGNWSLSYGSDAFFIPGVTNIESDTVTLDILRGTIRYVGEATNRSALQIFSKGVVSEITSPDYVEILLAASDYGVHQSALYFRDWSNAGQTQAVTFFDGRTEKFLTSTQVVAVRGVYLPFVFKESVKVRVQNASGPSYLTGVFVDPVNPLTVKLTSAQNGSVLRQPAEVVLQIEATAPGREVTRIELWDHGRLRAVYDHPVTEIVLTDLEPGEHEIKAVASGTYSVSGESESVRVVILPATTQVEFAGIDETTQGAWKEKYGRTGRWLIGEEKHFPGNFIVESPDAGFFTFVDSTTDLSALQRPEFDDRFAACLFGQDFTLRVNALDGHEWIVSLYLLDWANSQRDMDVRVQAPDGTLLDTQSVNGFAGGKYYRWRVRGEPHFRFISKSVNAVVSAVFIDPLLSPFEIWLRDHFGANALPDLASLAAADSDRDGFSNALEYFLGTDPTLASSKPVAGYTSSGGWFQISFLQGDERPDMSLSFERSNEMQHWSPVAPVSITQKTVNGTRLYFNFPAGGRTQFIRYSTRAR